MYILTHRFMLGLAGLPSLVMFFGFLFMPESPRWLVFKGKTEKARWVLGRVRQHYEVEKELKTIIKDHEEHKKSQRGKCHNIHVLKKKSYTLRCV